MDVTVSENEHGPEVPEVRIKAGITPPEVEGVLDLAAASGLFSSDAMMSAEDMAWDSAYGDGSAPHDFLLAVLGEPGNARPVGFVCYGPIPHWPDSFELYGIAVDPEFRRMGIGSALVAEVNRRVAALRGKRIFLETGTDRAFEPAHAFYEVNGYERESRFHKQFIPVEGGVVYRLNVDPGEADPNYQ
jgi:ribosomal protein S18 acetylase RimI-like enzyme